MSCMYGKGIGEDCYTRACPVHGTASADPYGPRQGARPKSLGHICFVPRVSGGWFEYFARSGHIYRMDSSAPVMPDGYRCGRWHGPDREDIRAAIAAAQ